MSKERVLVVCPGRGSYTKETLGYLNFFQPEIAPFLKSMDSKRQQQGDPSLSELDSAKTFKTNVHTKGEHASTLIYACSYGDYMALDRGKYEVVAITGNSMGWYIALALAKALNWDGAYSLIQTMGSMMRDELIGGQIIYPVVNERWQRDGEKRDLVVNAVREVNGLDNCEAYVSIWLGGYMVLAGNKSGLAELNKRLPKVEHYPFQLINHGAFHTPMLQETSEKAFSVLSEDLFTAPEVPLVDGRGKVWMPYTSDIEELYNYTLGQQVSEPYDFTSSVKVALKEFAPEKIVLLGPGNSLGGVLGQIMIDINWHGISSKEEFSMRQRENPILISMGLPGVREQGHTSVVNLQV